MPSTSSSNTMSAWLMPVWGRAHGLLSILTTMAGCRLVAGLAIGRPVSG